MKIRLRGRKSHTAEGARAAESPAEVAPVRSEEMGQRRGFLKLLVTGAGLVGAAGLGQVAVPARRAEAADETVTGNLYVTGNASIGTTDPGGYRLKVAGQVFVNGIDIDAFDVNLDRDASGRLAISATNGAYFTGGNVGIGEPDPHSQLHITKALEITRNVTDFSPDTDGFSINYLNAAPNEKVYFKAGTSVLMTLVNNTGFVGIATTGPAEKLHLVGGKIRVDDRVVADGNGCYYA